MLPRSTHAAVTLVCAAPCNVPIAAPVLATPIILVVVLMIGLFSARAAPTAIFGVHSSRNRLSILLIIFSPVKDGTNFAVSLWNLYISMFQLLH